MNKLLIVFLAVALVSVHAFVKRDAPPAGDDVNYVAQLEKNFNDLKTTVEEKLNKALNPEDIKKEFSEFIDNFSKAFNDLKAKSEAPK